MHQEYASGILSENSNISMDVKLKNGGLGENDSSHSFV